MKNPGEIVRFKIFLSKRDYYWVVIVFFNKRWMRRAFHKLNATKDKKDRFGAIVMPQIIQSKIDGKWKATKSLGYVLLSQTQLGVETQCHESVHMATCYLRRIKQFPRMTARTINAREETLAYYIGKCADKLHRNLYKYHCYGSKYD